jgi:hypothetical protein
VVTNLTGTASININGTVGATTANTGAFTTLSASGDVTLSGGTANGVAFLNGSKVLTTGSALTFDGTNLALTQSGNPTMTVKASGAGNNPSYRLQADTNFWEMVGVFSEADDNLRLRYNGTDVYIVGNTGISAWQVGGSEQMRLTSTGLGIGTSSPSFKLDVIGTGRTTAQFTANSSYTNTTAGLFFTDNTSASGATFLIRRGRDVGAGSVDAVGLDCLDGASSAVVPLAIRSTTMNLIVSGANHFAVNTNGSERLRLDSSGNLGLGVTPSAWGAGQIAMDIGLGSAIWNPGTVSQTQVLNNSYFNNTNFIYKGTAAASRYRMTGAQHEWYNAPSGTAGDAISFTQAMSLLASGDLAVGATTSTSSRIFTKGANTGSAEFAFRAHDSADAVLFFVRNDGYTQTGTSTNSPYNLTTASAANLVVQVNGELSRSTSSLKYKTDVADSAHGLAEVMQLRPVTYKGKNDGDTVFGGLIAEEVHAAGLTEFVQYAPDGSPDALAYGQMVSLAFKAIQELKAEFDAYKATHP